jgi:glycosyltransferase involved in cell wall biosynthesis
LPRESALEILGLPSQNKYILFFGFIRDYKGLDLLIEALKSLPDDHHLIVAGEVYGSFDKYQSIIDQHGLNSRIHLYNDYIGDSEVPVYFSASDVCVLPYKGATQSGITAIAQHFELPVIATDVGGLKEVVADGKEGLIVSKPQPDLIAQELKNYFENDLKEKFKPNIKVRKEENSWSNFAKKIVDFSDSI